jgi:hypothetical protein
MMFSVNRKITILVFLIFFTVYVFTSDAHRYTFDEDASAQQSLWLTTFTPDPSFVLGESRTYFNYPELFPPSSWQYSSFALCQHELLCSSTAIGHSVTQIPFIWLNHTFGIFNDSNFWSATDFEHAHYVWWRNSINPDFTFMELFYGPFFSALSVAVFYLISRSFHISQQNSIIVTFLFGLSTVVWAYSQTSLNIVPQLLFVLLAVLFFKKFQKSQSSKNLILIGSSLGFAFLTRPDTILIIIVLSIFILLLIRQSKSKLNYVLYIFPISSFIFLFDYLEFVRKGSFLLARAAEKSMVQFQFLIGGIKSTVISETQVTAPVSVYTPLEAFFGLLFSPGAGLFIFCPILFLSFFTFTDFYKNHKKEFFLFIGIIAAFLFYFSIFNSNSWHGLVGWSARYVILLIPFLLLPLGLTLDKRKNKPLLFIILILGSLGVLFNLVWLIQDVSWFVWAGMGESQYGLYSLPSPGWTARISPLVLWTFEFSQLTNAIFLAFTHLQLDIFLLKILTPIGYSLSFVAFIGSLLFSLFRLLRNEKKITV